MTIRILIADDHLISREAIQTLFMDQTDLEIVGLAADGLEVALLAQETEPDLLMMEIMPYADGIQAARKIKSKLPQTAILVFSAYGDNNYILQMLQCGVQGYFLKTAPKEEILKAVRTVASGGYYFDSLVSRKLVGMLLDFNQKIQTPISSTTLSAREIEVLQLAAQGLANKEIAQSLELTERTVKNHMSSIFNKMRCISRSEAVAKGLREGCISL